MFFDKGIIDDDDEKVNGGEENEGLEEGVVRKMEFRIGFEMENFEENDEEKVGYGKGGG